MNDRIPFLRYDPTATSVELVDEHGLVQGVFNKQSDADKALARAKNNLRARRLREKRNREHENAVETDVQRRCDFAMAIAPAMIATGASADVAARTTLKMAHELTLGLRSLENK